MKKPCEILSHSADLKISLKADTWEKLLEKSAQSFSFLVLDSLDFNRRPVIKEKKIKIAGETKEERLVNFFNDIIFILDTESLLPKSGRVKKDFFKGEFFQVTDSDIKEQIKSATFHGLDVRIQKDQFVAKVIFDV